MRNPIRAAVEGFREDFPGGIQEVLGELRNDRNERRRRSRLNVQEKTLEDVVRHNNVLRAEVPDGWIATEHQARELMESVYGERLRYVEFEDGMTIAILQGGQRHEHDEAGRRIN
ncbi:hypothetical protein [Pseudarthrobacter sp. J47]|uniref:hypothetical protein n=1 Tax=Pseudarthrobacter sp. J47 TaxID=3116482 RepID=UPI002E801710|nr:hypothetical protein [Pseudarthrobacter sp. J47]MEE2524522.1 hypothetical protein [Pseudarthrobacter sp. J47]